MNEREIRDLLGTIRADLDRRFRALLRKAVIPTALGAGLVLGACSDDTNGPNPDSIKSDMAVVDSGQQDKGPGSETGVDQKVADSAKADQAKPDLPKWDFQPPPPPYMAPDAAPLYQSVEKNA
jgi:hypothetical protein